MKFPNTIHLQESEDTLNSVSAMNIFLGSQALDIHLQPLCIGSTFGDIAQHKSDIDTIPTQLLQETLISQKID